MSSFVTLIVAACSVGHDASPPEPTGDKALRATKAVAPSDNGAVDFCSSPEAPCAAGEGDCDSSLECQTGLICSTNVGPRFHMGGVWDVCVPQHCTDRVLTPGTDETGVDCGAEGSSCGICEPCLDASNLGSPIFCSSLCRCGSGEGDCDTDRECQPGLVCSKDVGPRFDMGSAADVCVPPHCTDRVLTAGTDETGIDCGAEGSACGPCRCPDPDEEGSTTFCSALCPCGAGQGDCDGPAECQRGLVCGKDVGPRFGLSGLWDVCIALHCRDGVLTPGTDETGIDCGATGSSCGECVVCPDATSLGSSTFCSSFCPCAAGEGDCDLDSECQPGLACSNDFGPRYGMPRDIDVCLAPGTVAKNVVLFIGDGMGFEQLLAARAYSNGDTAPLTLETLPHSAQCTTSNASGTITDSAAAGTAIATGNKVSNGRVSVDAAGAELRTVLELSRARRQVTGLVTIIDPIVGATPAAFGAHAADRALMTEIASDYRSGSQPNLLVGAPSAAVVRAEFEGAGYRFVSTREEFMALDGTTPRVVSSLADSAVTLAERTAVALDVLDQSPTGFFLMVEQAGTDKAGHAKDLRAVIDAVLALDRAVEVALRWAAPRSDTLIIVTSDHETGWLDCTVDADHPALAGALPTCAFGSGTHSGVNVPVFADGLGAEAVAGTLDNTDLFRILAGFGLGPR